MRDLEFYICAVALERLELMVARGPKAGVHRLGACPVRVCFLAVAMSAASARTVNSEQVTQHLSLGFRDHQHHRRYHCRLNLMPTNIDIITSMNTSSIIVPL